MKALASTFPATPRSHWHRLFSYPWLPDHKKPDYGTVAELDGLIVGFLGAMYAQRFWGGEPTLCCHMIGWWVAPEVRGSGIGGRLVGAYLEARRRMPIMLLTLRPDHMEFWLQQGVVPFDERRRVLFRPLIQWGPGNSGWLSAEEVERGASTLSDKDLQIWRDHRHLKCQTHVLSTPKGQCLIVSRKRTVTASGLPGYRFLMKRHPTLRPGANSSGIRLQLDRLRDLLAGRIPCAEVLYVSDKALAREYLGPVCRKLCRAQRTLAVLADERRLDLPEDPLNRNPGHYYTIPNGTPISWLDALYAEFLLLDM